LIFSFFDISSSGESASVTAGLSEGVQVMVAKALSGRGEKLR
jgi:hypothetical protein